MDYDHPYRDRLKPAQQYWTALLIAGCVGLVWAFDDAANFVEVQARAESTVKAVVIDYEMAGGRERIRVQVPPGENPGYNMLVDSLARGPRYASGQVVELLSMEVPNSMGQPLTQTVAYAPRNYWMPIAKKTALSLLALSAAGLGLNWRSKKREIPDGRLA